MITKVVGVEPCNLRSYLMMNGGGSRYMFIVTVKEVGCT